MYTEYIQGKPSFRQVIKERLLLPSFVRRTGGVLEGTRIQQLIPA